MKRSQRFLFSVVPTLFFASLSAILAVSLYHTKQGNPNGSRPIPDVFLPVDVNYHYERSGQKILLQDSTFGQIWLPVLSDVPLSTHPLERLRQDVETGRMHSYNEAGSWDALTGIDISAHNTVTDWDAVKADGIDFVMLRLGYRTYGGGELEADTMFAEHYQSAKAAGLKIGAYFFSQAVNEVEAEEEAMFALQQLGGRALDYPLVFDWEMIFNDAEGARTDNVAVEALTAATLTFCQNVEAYGYTPMIYQNKRTALLKCDLPRLKDYPMWLAEYGDGPTYIYDYAMWQYSCTGGVNGIDGNVDMNLSFADYTNGVASPVCVSPLS